MLSFPWYKVCLSFMWSNPQIVDIEYPQGICSDKNIFVVEEFCRLFAHPSIFLKLVLAIFDQIFIFTK